MPLHVYKQDGKTLNRLTEEPLTDEAGVGAYVQEHRLAEGTYKVIDDSDIKDLNVAVVTVYKTTVD